MDIKKKMIVDQEQIDMDDEMDENEDEEQEDNVWLGRLGALLSPCRPIYHSTGQPLYPDISAESVKAEVIARLAQEWKMQNQAIFQQARELNEVSAVDNSKNSSIHFENADVTITKIRRENSTNSQHKIKTGINAGNFQPISVANISNGNTKAVNANGVRYAVLVI